MSEELTTTKPATLAVEHPGGVDLNQLFKMAIDRGPEGVATLERMMVMRREMKAEAAKESYLAAMSDFQRDCPPVPKRAKVMNRDGGGVRYRFAPITDVAHHIAPLCEKYGFSYTFDSKTERDEITAICIVTHRDGHAESSRFTIKVDPGATRIGMSIPQAYASALSYSKRYALLNAFGIQTTDEDDDANSTHPNSAKARLAKLKDEQRGQYASAHPEIVHGGAEEDDPRRGPDITHVESTITAEVQDILTMIGDAKDAEDIKELSGQVANLPESPGKEAARAALLARTTALGFRWSKGKLIQ